MIVCIRKERAPMVLDTTHHHPQCQLLALPAELRNQIWHDILIQDTDTQGVEKKTRFCANVLRTCKQINTEGTPILYGENVFFAHPQLLASLPSFLLLTRPYRVKLPPVISPRVTPLIRRYFIYVRLDTDPRFTYNQAAESFSGVEELQIEVFQAMYASSDFSTLELFEGVRGVGKVTLVGSLGDGKYAEWLAMTMQMPTDAEVEPYHEQWIGGSQVWNAWLSGKR